MMMVPIMCGAVVALWLIVRLLNVLVPPRSLMNAEAGALSPCPNRPNCVCSCQPESAESLGEHALQSKMAPIEYGGDWSDLMGHLELIVAQFPRGRVVERRNGYMRVEFRSLVFGFVDDVEFLLDESQRRVDFRSASRLGHSDFGVNRRRMGQIIRRLAAAN